MKLKVLFVDDHPTQIEGYKAILAKTTSGNDINTAEYYDFKSILNVLDAPSQPGFDIAFIDWSLPAYPEKKIKNGLDLALVLRKVSPATKICIITSHAEGFLLYNIVKKLEPCGLLVKSDFSGGELLQAFELMIQGHKYYTDTVKQCLKLILSKGKYLDSRNRQIIQLLSNGVKIKNIAEQINLSKSAVEKRKVHIKDYFGIETGKDEDIIKAARERGFI